MTITRTIKPNRCKHCRVRMPADKAHHVIHNECIEPWLEKKKARKAAKVRQEAVAAEKVDRAVTKARKEKAKSNAKWESECRAIVQKIARIRDRHDGCISCSLPPTWGGQWHGSHFRSHGAASAVQFHLWNINKSCSACNLHKSGNIIEYRPRLIAKIGQDRVDWLMEQNQITRLNVGYYIRFKAVMGKRLRRAEKRANA